MPIGEERDGEGLQYTVVETSLRKRELSRWLTVGAQSQCLCTQLQSSGYLRLHVARGLED
jgi:hypothetical protein